MPLNRAEVRFSTCSEAGSARICANILDFILHACIFKFIRFGGGQDGCKFEYPGYAPAQPRSRSNRKLIFLFMLFFITILLLLFFHSPFSRITSIEISGYVYVTETAMIGS